VTPRTELRLIQASCAFSFATIVMLLGCGWLKAHDPAVQYPADLKCDQYQDELCGMNRDGTLNCCNEGKGTSCNPASGRCEVFIETAPCIGPPLGCGNGEGKRARDGGGDE
jgi:hypothetical protein